MNRITGQAHRGWLEKLVDGKQLHEYKPMSKHWKARLSKRAAPFELLLINGYGRNTFQAVFLISKVETLSEGGGYREPVFKLTISKVLEVRNR